MCFTSDKGNSGGGGIEFLGVIVSFITGILRNWGFSSSMNWMPFKSTLVKRILNILSRKEFLKVWTLNSLGSAV